MSRDPTHPPSQDRRAVVAGLVATAATLAACQDAQAPVDDQGRVRIRFATDGPAQAEHGGFYQALASGAYARRGLNVQIIPGPVGVDVPQRLAAGAVELGLGSSSVIPLNLVAEGAPVKAVAAFFQKDPQVLIAHPDPDLDSIAGLTGRPMHLTEASVATVWPWLKARHGFTDEQLADYSPDLETFLADERAVREGSVTRDPDAIERAGRFQPRVFLLADDGYASYGGLVLAPDGFARDNGAALRGFIAASAEGWRDYMNGDPTAANALIKADNREMTDPVLAQAREAMNISGMVEGGDAALYGLGAMTGDRWRAFFEAMSQAGVYPADLSWRRAFSNAYLPGRA